VKVGSKGTSVLLLQEILKARGYYKGSLDREFGRETMDAVNKYQIERAKQGKIIGNGKGDGTCSQDMWKDLIAI
jgi:peptidoglycan hydrolase-like protein with peptidoglycan-binding domain